MQDVVKPWLVQENPQRDFYGLRISSSLQGHHNSKVMWKQSCWFFAIYNVTLSRSNCCPMDIGICVNVERGACAKPHISFDKLKTTVYKECFPCTGCFTKLRTIVFLLFWAWKRVFWCIFFLYCIFMEFGHFFYQITFFVSSAIFAVWLF